MMSVTGQMPKATDLREVLSFKKPDLNLRRRRLDAALTIDDPRTIARRRTPRTKPSQGHTARSAKGCAVLAAQT